MSSSAASTDKYITVIIDLVDKNFDSHHFVSTAKVGSNFGDWKVKNGLTYFHKPRTTISQIQCEVLDQFIFGDNHDKIIITFNTKN